eukprot:3865347-Karenia_brevis.AAC.1
MKNSKEERAVTVTSKIAQRAQRQCTSYYCGYSFKVQPVGQKTTSDGHTQSQLLGRVPSKKSIPQKWH